MTVEEGLQTLTGQILATQALTHALVVALIKSDRNLAQALRTELGNVYNALPARLHGVALENFQLQWEEIHRLIDQNSPK